ncbi:hypothetical protein AB833_10210 [Chromatiales bacterium (ex Bugula neritina AB1)]|nr:hypothetical protein AB833_10210 [Chromatiales bacterium (ex Bugula neritina AB1)]
MYVITNSYKFHNFNAKSQFVEFVTNTLLPNTGADADCFWADLAQRLNEKSETENRCQTTAAAKPIALLDRRTTLHNLNSRWGSLYSALYNADTIPQSAGLKIGNRFNEARANRVTDHARKFLDAACPLTEGSHKDAVTYLVYFQNLMAILADGSTVGLQNPSQFVARNGPRNEPESILLQHQQLHIEILFDRNGVRGSRDLSNIDDIQIEAPEPTYLSLETENVEQKCEVYNNLIELARGRLQTTYDSRGKSVTRRVKRCTPYTLKCGEEVQISCTNDVLVDPEHSRNELNLITDQNGNSVPQRVVDRAVASWIIEHGSFDNSGTSLELSRRKPSNSRSTAQNPTVDPTVSASSADIPPSKKSHIAKTRTLSGANENKKGVDSGNPVMTALHRHGFAHHQAG